MPKLNAVTIRYRVMETSPAVSPKGRLSNHNRGGVPNPTLLSLGSAGSSLFVRNGRFGSRKQIGSQESQCLVHNAQDLIISQSFSRQTALHWLLTQKRLLLLRLDTLHHPMIRESRILQGRMPAEGFFSIVG